MSPTLSRHIDHIGKDYQTLCRLCLKKTSLRIDIYQEEGLQREIPGKIQNCLSLIVTKDDPLPKFVCITCTHKLDNFQDFRDMCRESENLLIKYVSTVEECNQKEQHNQAPSVSPLSPCMEAESKQEVDLGESHSPPSHEPSPAFVNCSIKTEPQDVDPSYSPHEETTSDTVKSITSTAIKSEVAEEQMDVGDLDALGESISQDYLQTEAGTSGLGQQDSEHLVASDNSAQFCASVFENSDDEAAEIVPDDVKESELKIEADEPVVEEERCTWKNSGIGGILHQGYVHFVKDSHLAEASSQPLCTKGGSVGTHDLPKLKLDIKKGKNFKPLPSKFMLCCPECKKTFTRRNHLETHMRTHTGEKPFPCPTCNRAFISKAEVKRHSRTHTGEKLYACSTCSKSFTTSHYLKVHSSIHTGEKKFECFKCKKKFSRKDRLKVHLRIHTGEKKFECPTCNKLFAEKCYLQRHSVIHSGKKPFICPTCNKGFQRKADLEKHSGVHAEERAYVCSTCKKGFIRKDRLKKHLTVHSG